MIKGIIDSYELWQSRPENLSEDIPNIIDSAENRGWNQCNRRWIETIEEQPRVGEWIPCSERLPELGEHVLCMCRADIQEVMRLTPDGWFHDHNHCYMGGFVIAWMPLPGPYKGK